MRAAALIFVLLLVLLPFAFAQEETEFEDPQIFGLEVEKLLAFFGANLAAALAILTFLAYQRTKRDKLLWVVFAFSLFSAKLFLISTELFIDEIPWVDIVTTIFDFAILLAFFVGILKK